MATTESIDVPDFTFISGVGDYSEGKACVMSAAVAKWRLTRGEPLGEATDSLDCVCPVVRHMAIGLNDGPWWADAAERTAVLKPWIDRVIGTRDDSLVVQRAMLCADQSVRILTPIAFDAAGLTEQAAALRGQPVIEDEAAARAAYSAASAAASAAYSAAASAAYSAADSAAYSAAVRDELLKLLGDLCDLRAESA